MVGWDIYWENQPENGPGRTGLSGKLASEVNEILKADRPKPIYISELGKLLGFNRQQTLRLLKIIGWVVNQLHEGIGEKKNVEYAFEELLYTVVSARGLPYQLGMSRHPASLDLTIALRRALMEFAFDYPPTGYVCQQELQWFFNTFDAKTVLIYRAARAARRDIKNGKATRGVTVGIKALIQRKIGEG